MNAARTSDSLSTSHSLILRLKARDEKAWERMVYLYAPLMSHWCSRSNLNPEEAADVTQDVLRTVSQSIGDFQRKSERGTFRGWLRTIFRSRVVDYVRRNQRQPRARGGTDALRWLENSAATDETDLDEGTMDLYKRVLDLIQSEFSDSAWQASWKTTVDAQSAAEVARELGMTHGAVRQAKYRILRRVREELGDID
jgi:RNA polymerase sigma-70 factor (ECF subfamily)